MKTTDVIIGVDISKHTLDVFGFCDGEKSARFSNDEAGIGLFIERLEAYSGVVVAMEASGGYERGLRRKLGEVGLRSTLLHPKQVRDFARAKGVLAKTDALDAKIIAEYVKVFGIRETVEKDEILGGYVGRRDHLVAMIRLEKSQLEHTVQADIRQHIFQHIEALEEMVAQMEEQISARIAAQPALQQRYNILVSCKGVGAKTSAVLLAELPELGHLESAKLTALAGLAPFNQDSGAMRGIRRIRGGRPKVRKALYMATLSAVRHNKDIAEFYNRLIAKGKKPKIALTAAMRKLLCLLGTLCKHNRPWEEAHPGKTRQVAA